jgi:hypothetical protein
MLNKSKLFAAVTIAMLGLASPALAQSFSNTYGTGNVLPGYYDSEGGLHMGIAHQQNQIAMRRSGLNAFASIPGAASGQDNPSLTGGGSVGYNNSVRTDY